MTTSVELERGTGLRQPEVSIVIKQLDQRDWIKERKRRSQAREDRIRFIRSKSD